MSSLVAFWHALQGELKCINCVRSLGMLELYKVVQPIVHQCVESVMVSEAWALGLKPH